MSPLHPAHSANPWCSKTRRLLVSTGPQLLLDQTLTPPLFGHPIHRLVSVLNGLFALWVPEEATARPVAPLLVETTLSTLLPILKKTAEKNVNRP